jgi:hypothetical protein
LSIGWHQRLAILRREAEQKLVAPLRTHGWTAAIMSEIEAGEYLLITAERGEHRHAVALLYTSATDNSAYRRAAPYLF